MLKQQLLADEKISAFECLASVFDSFHPNCDPIILRLRISDEIDQVNGALKAQRQARLRELYIVEQIQYGADLHDYIQVFFSFFFWVFV